ncbi:P-loop containing nucleoside triphosphate hydrolase protein [Irpex lacteus]|nr:P-loop containing nucleoside triphosphate hydrolase protein [Irpex lacteus]
MAHSECHPPKTKPWLKQLLRDKCHIEARPFQLDNGLHLSRGTSAIVVSPPGSGKSILMAAPLLAAQEMGESGIGLVVVPTKLLGEQLAGVLSSYGLNASAINEDTMRAASLASPRVDLWAKLVKADGVRVAIVSPQMLSSEHVTKILQRKATYDLLRWFFVDEAHLVHEESGDWRVAYGSVKTMRQRLPVTAVWGLFTGTATPTEVQAIAKTLGFKPGHYVNVRYPCGRSHIKYMNLFMQYPYSGYEFFDLAFLIPPEARSPSDIPRTLVFCDTIDLGSRVITFLDALFPSSFPRRSEVVMPYNSLMSKDYRKLFVEDMVDGSTLRIGVCTETCTYGLDISCIRRVVVFGLFPSFAAGKQRLCRAGRDGLPAEAYSFVPLWVKDVPVEDIKGQQAKDDAARRAKLSPVVLQWHNPTAVMCPRQLDASHNGEAPPAQVDDCCSLHSPEPQASQNTAAISHHRTAYHAAYGLEPTPRDILPRSDGTYRALEAVMVKAVVRMLQSWRGRIWIEKVRGSQRDALSCDFLPSSIIKRLAPKAHICTSLDNLKQVIRTPPWKFFDRYGELLLEVIKEMMQGFDEILQERKQQPAAAQASTSVPRVRLIMKSANVPVPEKRSADDDNSVGNTKRPCIDKENF